MNAQQHQLYLNEKRMRTWHEAKALLDRAAGEHREMNGEEQRAWDQMNAEIDDLDAQRTMFTKREQRERENAELREAHPGVFGSHDETRQVDWNNDDHMLRRLASRNDPFVTSLEIPLDKVVRERQMLRAGASAQEIRSLLWDTGNIASAVPVSMARSMYEVMEAEISMLRMPTTKIVTSSGENMDFPIMNVHGIGTQVIAQGTAIGGTDPTFTKVTLQAFKYGQLLQISNEVMQDTAVDIGSIVGRDMGRALGRVIDTDLVAGSGSSKPMGIVNAIGGAGTIATGGTLITPTYEKLIDLVYSVNDAYRASSGAAWLMRDATAGQLRKLRVGAGGTSDAPLWQPSITMGITNGQPDTLLGYPSYSDPNVASLGSNARIMVYGDWNAYYVRQVGNPIIERSDDFAFNADLVTLRAKWRVDGDLLDTGALNLMKQSVT